MKIQGQAGKKGKLRRGLHTFFKIFIIFMIATAAINLLLLAVVYFNHKSKLGDEKGYLTPPGEMVTVNGHEMHVLVEGPEDAEKTLVFLHTCNVVDDSIALQPLFDELKDYRLVYVDRSGYGYSENSGADRDIDTILEETRQAIAEAGITGEYTIVATGTGGIEAFYWAYKYPKEVENVIGINITYPEQFKDTTTESYCGFFDYLMVWFCKIGGHRFVKSVYPSNDYMLYTELQMKVRKALISKGGYTKDMYNEDLETVNNANYVAGLGFPEQVNMYMIYANPLMEPYASENDDVRESYEDEKKKNEDFDYVKAYNEEQRDYFAKYSNVKFAEMPGPARLYTYDPKTLADLIVDYIE